MSSLVWSLLKKDLFYVDVYRRFPFLVTTRLMIRLKQRANMHGQVSQSACAKVKWISGFLGAGLNSISIYLLRTRRALYSWKNEAFMRAFFKKLFILKIYFWKCLRQRGFRIVSLYFYYINWAYSQICYPRRTNES